MDSVREGGGEESTGESGRFRSGTTVWRGDKGVTQGRGYGRSEVWTLESRTRRHTGAVLNSRSCNRTKGVRERFGKVKVRCRHVRTHHVRKYNRTRSNQRRASQSAPNIIIVVRSSSSNTGSGDPARHGRTQVPLKSLTISCRRTTAKRTPLPPLPTPPPPKTKKPETRRQRKKSQLFTIR